MRSNRPRTPSESSSESDHDHEEEDDTTPADDDGLVTYYTVLQVLETAKPIDIRKAYLRLVLTTHPDRTGSNGDPDALAFRTIKDAHDVLSNNERRWEYDLKLDQIRNPIPPEDRHVPKEYRYSNHFPVGHHPIHRPHTQQFYYIPPRPAPTPALFSRNVSFQYSIRPIIPPPPLRMQVPVRPIFTPPLTHFPVPVRPRFRRSMPSVYM